ncbi:MAG: hypothetical protein CBB71_02425 [Rhodopirellula sp. TMED11]|nr:MAG: hypothetical protein CBB71_02425 [Rhodopirellula sp. TMED11]
MNLTQQNRTLTIKTDLGDDKVVIQRFHAEETLGRPFQFHARVLVQDGGVKIEDLLATATTVTLISDGSPVYYHGVINRINWVDTQGSMRVFDLSIVPELWMLTRRADCRIFQFKSVVDIVKSVVTANGFTMGFKTNLLGTPEEREYCVQYRETDFDFVHRLLQEEGIYYYFVHSASNHEMVLVDANDRFDNVPNYTTMNYVPPDKARSRQEAQVNHWEQVMEVQSGVVTLNDFDFEKPRTDLTAKSVINRSHPHSSLEVYDYPGEYVVQAKGDESANVDIQGRAADYTRNIGECNIAQARSGYRFSLAGHPFCSSSEEHLIVSSSLQVNNQDYFTGQQSNDEQDTIPKIRFNVISVDEPFRNPRLVAKPQVVGLQTAIVVGKKGEEIWTDAYGRVKVQFHWDREGKNDENSSCWVRVSNAWAGANWGAIHIPRIGQEVVVEFLEGDPDKPLITGRVYNAMEMPPYQLPENQTQSGIKTRSSPDGTPENFNELRFEDKKDAEQVYFHAERDFARVVENNDSVEVGLVKGADTGEGNQEINIFNDQTTEVGVESGAGKRTTTVFSDDALTVQDGHQTLDILKGNRTEKIAKGNDALTIDQGDQTIKITAGKQTVTAGAKITLKCGGSSIVMTPTAITLKATTINLEGQAKLAGKAAAVEMNGSATTTIKGGMVKIN